MLQWIPSHTGIIGNELVDCLAKNACNYNTITYLDFEYEELLSIVKKNFKIANRNTWFNIRNNISIGTIIEDIFKWNWITSGNRHCDVLIAKLRNNVANLNSYLYKLKLIDSPNCIYCINTHETIKHYLLDCPRYILARNKMYSRLSDVGLVQNNISVSILLSGSDFSPNKWRKIMFALFTYFKDTGKIDIL